MNYKPKQYDYYLGIDPDFEASGFSMLDKQNRCITESHALPFPDAIKYLDALAAGDMKDKTLVIIEDSFSTTNWHIDKLVYAPIDLKPKLRKAASMGHGIGLCHSTQVHLQQYAESVGLDVKLQKPLKKCWKGPMGKITQEEISSFMTGFPKRSNSEMRDSALLCWVVGNMPIRLHPKGSLYE